MTTEDTPKDPTSTIEIPSQSPLFHSIHLPRYDRQSQIRKIEEVTGRRLIAYVAGPATSIGSADIPPFVDLLSDVDRGSDLDLLLHTPGGDVDQAERIVTMCRTKIGADARFRVIVPDSAKSAGTLIALASDEIVMGYCSELGPIDPQIFINTKNGETMARPATSFLDGLDEIIASVGTGTLSPAYFPLLDKLDPALIDFCKKAIARSERFATEFLAKYMLAGDPAKAAAVAQFFNDQKKHLSHGAAINADLAAQQGLKITYLEPESDLWNAYWMLYVQMRLTWQNTGQRLFESRKTSLLL